MRRIALCLGFGLWTFLLYGQNPSPTNIPASTAPIRLISQRFDFQEGDRIVFLGDPWLGNEQQDGYLETMLTSRLQGKRAIFRNLAWNSEASSGSKSRFEPLEKSIKRLKPGLQTIQPTVAFLAYGTAESRNGQGGLQVFTNAVTKLIDTIANLSSPAQVRFVIVTPLYDESSSSETASHNEQRALYAGALREIAIARKANLIDLFEAMRKEHTRRGAVNWAEDGSQASPYGYWQIAAFFEWSLRLFPGIERMGIGVNNSVRRGSAGILPHNINRTPTTIRFEGTDEFVLRPLAPKRPDGTADPDGMLIQFYPLPPGKYTLKIDGQVSAVDSGPKWMQAVAVRHGPLFERTEALRQAIIKKNQLCAQNNDRKQILGFTKAKSDKQTGAPASEPAVGALEQEIFRLTELKTRQYELAPSQPGDEERLNGKLPGGRSS